jgi:hypothetical protein
MKTSRHCPSDHVCLRGAPKEGNTILSGGSRPIKYDIKAKKGLASMGTEAVFSPRASESNRLNVPCDNFGIFTRLAARAAFSYATQWKMGKSIDKLVSNGLD